MTDKGKLHLVSGQSRVITTEDATEHLTAPPTNQTSTKEKEDPFFYVTFADVRDGYDLPNGF